MPLERWPFALRARLRALFRRSRVEREMDEELQFHIHRQVEANRERGMTTEAARAAALRALGGVDRRKDECREARRVQPIENLSRDVRYALAAMRRSPAFACAAVLSLALGIGANTAIFSLIDSLLLRSLPVRSPDRLAVLGGPASPNGLWTYAIWDEVRRQPQIFDSACAWGRLPPRLFRFDLSERGEAKPIDGVFASGDCFHSLGVPAHLGRMFSAADDEPGQGPDGPVAVVGHAFWRRHFGGAPEAVGARLTINRVPFTVVGVAPPEFFGPEPGRTFDVVVPLNAERLLRGRDAFLGHRLAFWLSVVLRLRPDLGIEQTTAALVAAQPQVREGAMPPQARERFLQEPFALAPAAAGTSSLRQRYQRPLLTLFAIVALVLLVACANVANLLLARGASRAHELAIRAALGASRWRITQQLLVESLVLSIAGAGAGLLFAVWSSRALVARLSTEEGSVFLNVALDWRVLAFTAVVALATTLLVGTLPASRGAAMPPSGALKEDGRRSAGRSRSGLADALVAGQIALSVVLVVAAGLLLQTFARLASVPLGFDADRILVADVRGPAGGTDAPRRLDLFQRLADAAAGMPGVEAAAASVATPLRGSTWGGNRVDVPGAPPLPERESTALVNFVSPGWFATYGIPVLEGRDVDRRDVATGQRVAVVNEAFARRFFPGRSAVGGAFRQVPSRWPQTIVGVVADSLYGSVREPHAPIIYIPLAQFDWSEILLAGVRISVRTAAGSPASHAHALAATLSEVDPDLAFTFRPLSEDVRASVAHERLIAALAGAFGALALALASVGIYGVTAYAVSRRRAELGIRLTLGAGPARIVRLVMTRVLVILAVGLAAGVTFSMWAARFLAALLYELQPRDTATFVAAAALLAAVGALAGAVPAWRASRIDAARVLRET